MKDNGDGTYDVVFNPDIDGPHTISVKLDDTPIKDMPKIGMQIQERKQESEIIHVFLLY